ncbi:MAG: glycoside hydrolase family 13 protein, partial [Nevskia sp.]|nr:glycoside hydrolase family 13 protein [Nevskia sp.]
MASKGKAHGIPGTALALALLAAGCGLATASTDATATSIPAGIAAASAPGAAAGSWTPQWAKDAVFYQIFPERFRNGDPSNDPPGTLPWGGQPQNFSFFGGDLAGVLQKLDYLQDLGVTAIYFNPIFTSPSNHKYDTVDYLQIDPHFGDLSTFQSLLQAAHARGMHVILDGVFNHTSNQNPKFIDASTNGPSSPYWSWYNIYGLPVVTTPTPNYDAWWGFATLPKLMVEKTPAVADYLINQVVDFWDKQGIDGWRLDVPNEVGTDFWDRFRQKVKGDNPNAYIVGEIWTDATAWVQGDKFDSVMNYMWRGNMLQFFAQESMNVDTFDANQAALRSNYPLPATQVMFNLLGSHDTERFLYLAGGDVWKLKAAAFYQMTYPGTPVIYYGDEIGMTGGKDPDDRRCFPWDQSVWNADLRQHYHTLIRLREAHSALRT